MLPASQLDIPNIIRSRVESWEVADGEPNRVERDMQVTILSPSAFA